MLSILLFLYGLSKQRDWTSAENKNCTEDVLLLSDIVNAIVAKNDNEIDIFFDTYPEALRWIEISGYDFKKNGTMDIILSFEYVETSTIISYNKVFDNCGNLLFDFVGNDILQSELYVNETADKYYLQSDLHIAADHNVTLYQEISYNKNWNTELKFAEWDCRNGQEQDENKKEGYAVYDCFTPKETESIMKIGYENMLSIFQIKEAKGTEEQLENYMQSYRKYKKEKVIPLGNLYQKNKSINWISNQKE